MNSGLQGGLLINRKSPRWKSTFIAGTHPGNVVVFDGTDSDVLYPVDNYGGVYPIDIPDHVSAVRVTGMGVGGLGAAVGHTCYRVIIPRQSLNITAMFTANAAELIFMNPAQENVSTALAQRDYSISLGQSNAFVYRFGKIIGQSVTVSGFNPRPCMNGWLIGSSGSAAVSQIRRVLMAGLTSSINTLFSQRYVSSTANGGPLQYGAFGKDGGGASPAFSNMKGAFWLEWLE
jgi:hypothetical protein